MSKTKAAPKNRKPIFTIGSDPEMLLVDRKLGRPVSAIPILKHSKDNRIDLGDGGTIYYDNVLTEMTVRPGTTREEVVAAFREVFNRAAHYLGDNYQLVPRASYTFTEDECEHPHAKAAGCNPEFDAYGAQECYPPQFEGGFRSAGGHIHVGRTDWKNFVDKDDKGEYQWNNFKGDVSDVVLIDPMSKLNCIKLMDLVVGLPVAIIDTDESSAARKKLYGNAGRHRPTPYGVEYRSLGNCWLQNPESVELVYDLTTHALNVLESGEAENILNSVDVSSVVEAVDTNNGKIAQTLLGELKESVMPHELFDRAIKLSVRSKKASFYEEWGIKI